MTVTAGHRRPRAGIVLHHAPVEPTERARRMSLPLTAPLRTLEDLARTNDRHLARAAEQAELRNLIRREAVGDARLRRVLGDASAQPTRSEAERRLRTFLLEAQFAGFEMNVRINGHLVDVLFREQRLIVEFDSWEFHRTQQAFERDRRRDADHVAADYRVVRVTWRQLTQAPLALAARLGAALAAAQAPAYPEPR